MNRSELRRSIKYLDLNYHYVYDFDSRIRYIIRILRILREQREIGVSDLVSRTRINHQRCNTVLKEMYEQGYLFLSSNGNGRKYISLTPKGLDYSTKLFSLIPPK